MTTKTNKSGSVNEQEITRAIVLRDFNAYIRKEGETLQAKSLLRRDALRHTIDNLVTVSEWSNHHAALKREGKGEAIATAKKAAADYFREWFSIPKFLPTESKTQPARTANNQYKRALEVVQTCVAVADFEFSDGFKFEDDGNTYIARGTELAKAVWEYKKYDKDDTLKSESYLKTHPFITVFARTDQVYPGDVAWQDLDAMLAAKLGKSRPAKRLVRLQRPIQRGH